MFDAKEPPHTGTAPEGEGPDNLREMPIPTREARPVTNLAKIFGQFAQLQQQFGEQVCALEESVGQQREELAAQLPEMKQKINWLIESFQEQSRKEEEVRDAVARHEAELSAIHAQLRTLSEANAEWRSSLDHFLDLLVKARGLGSHAAAKASGISA